MTLCATQGPSLVGVDEIAGVLARSHPYGQSPEEKAARVELIRAELRSIVGGDTFRAGWQYSWVEKGDDMVRFGYRDPETDELRLSNWLPVKREG